MNEDQINLIVEKVLEKINQNNINKEKSPGGVIHVETNTVKPEFFDTGKPGDQVYLKDILSLDESPNMGIGLMEMKETTFDWTLNYDEIDYIIEGSLTININNTSVTGHAGDIIFIPKDSSIQFSAPNYAKFIYITYPADWQ